MSEQIVVKHTNELKDAPEEFRNAVGKKPVMAVSGLLLFGFVLAHMAGNLKLYQGMYTEGPHAGQWKIDVYGEGLREIGAPVLGYGHNAGGEDAGALVTGIVVGCLGPQFGL